MATVTGNSPQIIELLDLLRLKRVTRLSFQFKKNERATVTATMHLAGEPMEKLISIVKKYKLVEIENPENELKG
jgi:hypothetical protein